MYAPSLPSPAGRRLWSRRSGVRVPSLTLTKSPGNPGLFAFLGARAARELAALGHRAATLRSAMAPGHTDFVLRDDRHAVCVLGDERAHTCAASAGGRTRADGRLSDLLRRPAPATTTANLIGTAIAYLQLYWNAFIGKHGRDRRPRDGARARRAACPRTRPARRMALRPCLVCGAVTGGTRCPTHSRNGSTRSWRRIRPNVLALDGHRWRFCGQPATEVDHIRPVADGGTDHPSNLRSLCHDCHAGR